MLLFWWFDYRWRYLFCWYLIRWKNIWKYFSLWHFIETSVGPKQLCIRFDKIDGFIRVHGCEFRHLVLFEPGLFDKICDKIKYLVSEKSGIGIVLIIILEKSELIHIILCLLKKYELFMLQ